MKATEAKLTSFLAKPDVQFVIPVYQRNYDWTKAECRQLWSDIIAVGSDPDGSAHFIGSIVFIHEGIYSSAGINELAIIDGQQRLTTLTLLYLALYHQAEARQKERILKQYLINEFDEREGSKLKLRPTANNEKALQHILKGKDSAAFPEYSGLIHNYEHFRSLVTADNMDAVIAGLERLMFVEISLEKGNDDPQRIFESLNSTGLELSQADLIRNYILMGLDRKTQTRIYEDYWFQIEQSARDESKGNESLVSAFIRDYLTSENKIIPVRNKVYKEFKVKFPFPTEQHLEVALERIRTYASHYHKLINPTAESDSDIRRQLKYIAALGINVSFPFLLHVYEDYTQQVITKTQFVAVLELIQTYVWRRFIAGVPTNALGKLFMRLYEEVEQDNYVTSLEFSLTSKTGAQRLPRDKEIAQHLREKDLYNIKSSNKTYLLDRLENFNNKEPVDIEHNEQITVEHIFPQNPEPAWKSALSDDEYKEMKDAYLHTIANITLSGNNGSLSNKAFQTKRDMNVEGKEQGYRFSRLWLNRSLQNLEEWNLEELYKRADLIQERFLSIWPMPNVAPTNGAPEGEVNIFDVASPTSRKLKHIVLFDKKTTVKTGRDLYRQVISELFERSTEAFYSSALHEKLHISKDPEQLRTPLDLGEGYFLEGYLSMRRIFRFTKEALRVCSCEDELFVQFEVE